MLHETARRPVDDIPPELLIEIFAFCPAHDPLALLTLRKVSKWWREVINGSPRIWQHIRLDEETHSTSLLRTQAELWIQRSVPLRVDVELNIESLDLILPILSPILPFIDRWRSFTMTGKRKEAQTFPSISPITQECLDFLHIHIQGEDSQGLAKSTFVPEWPQNYIMSVRLLKLPHSQLLAPLRFTYIVIAEDNTNDFHTRADSILDFLSACPELENFDFSSWQHNEEPSTTTLPVVSLPNLHTLHLKNTCLARAILSSLYTPRLVNLYLAHLNIDFTLRGEYHEEGDSDDDAQDISRSPSSDHATGMGLRKLLARSQPPIVTLDMDFSDMRTKDFRYVFDRLPFLQDFLIVASDMSDTVIGLLRPFTLPGQDGTTHTRLPRLQCLSLYNCQRLSGDAVVDALVARSNVTDREPSNTLREVAIVDCDGFTSEHQRELRNKLGNRLRLG